VDDFAEVPVDVDFVPGDVLGVRGKTALELLEAAEQAATAKPGDATALYRRGLAQHRAGKEAQALEDLAAIVKRFPTFAEGYHARALILARLGREKEAKEDLAQFLKRSDRPVRKASAEALTLAYLGNREAGIRCLERAASASPGPAIRSKSDRRLESAP